ncbi:hypothetical protein AMTR_s00033p00171350 [Amborella trichopoda]|uniref:Uncharacterized protein n=1 Tax=Amborella trichopoda TaxID=13333 RepID=U5CWE7_AMBTC|nr:hypothetical protein AMTR_s00033p00171350 [Amborella trichopoda]
MAEAGGLPKRKVDKDGADALHKRTRRPNFDEDRFQNGCLTSELELHKKRNEELQRKWEEATGQREMTNKTWKLPTLSLKRRISVPHFDRSFFYHVQDSSTVSLCLI